MKVLPFPKDKVLRRPRRTKSAARALAQDITGLSDEVMDWGSVKAEAQILDHLLRTVVSTVRTLHARIDDLHPAE